MIGVHSDPPIADRMDYNLEFQFKIRFITWVCKSIFQVNATRCPRKSPTCGRDSSQGARPVVGVLHGEHNAIRLNKNFLNDLRWQIHIL